MKLARFVFTFAFWIACAGLWAWCPTAAGFNSEQRDLPILQSWSGDYPVSQLDRLPEGQRSSRVGFLGDVARFADFWQAFKPGEQAPGVDFGKYLVVFSRNPHFYNRTSIFKVSVKDGVLEVMAMETLSAQPIKTRSPWRWPSFHGPG